MPLLNSAEKGRHNILAKILGEIMAKQSEKVKQKIRDNKRKQREHVTAYQKKLREEIKPKMREKKRKLTAKVEKREKEVKRKGREQIAKARNIQKEKVRLFRAKVSEVKEKIRLGQRKQREIGREQKEKQELVLKPIIEKNRQKVEETKRVCREREKSKGRMLFAYSTMPSKKFADSTTYSPKHSTVPDPEFRTKMDYSPKHSTVPDSKFSDSLTYSPKHSTVPKPEFAEATTYSPKHTTVPKPEFAEKTTYSPKYSTILLEREMEKRGKDKEKKERILGYIENGIHEGARLRLDGRQNIRIVGDYPDTCFLAPTIFENTNPDMKIGREEIFGPVMSVMRTRNLAEAIEMCNDSPFGNGHAIFTSSGRNAREFQYQVNSGNVGINIGIVAPMAFFPFSGMKDSFFGILHTQGREAIRFFTESKVVIQRWV